ncbi:MAG: hypothetical protein IJ300_11330 [Clostridia bacterium]|nr:hypothetical protein [Clostridia bacterium]
MKVHEAIRMLETMPAGEDVNFLALECAHEREKKLKKKEIEDFLLRHAKKAVGYEDFLTASGYICSIHVNNSRNCTINFDEAYEYAYVDCGGFFDIYKIGAKKVEVEVTIGGK